MEERTFFLFNVPCFHVASSKIDEDLLLIRLSVFIQTQAGIDEPPIDRFP